VLLVQHELSPLISECPNELSARKRSKADKSHKFFAVVSQALEEIHHFTVQVVVGFDGRRGSIYEYCRGAAENFTVMSEVRRQKREYEVEMREFASIVSECDHFAPTLACPANQSAI
jgi:hypothetical protein